MITGSSFVRASARSCFANARPDWPGSIQSSSSKIRQRFLEERLRGLGVRSRAHFVACVDRLTLRSSRIAGSSSTTRMVGITGPPCNAVARALTPNLRADLLGRRVAHVDALDHLHHRFGDVLRVIADALDRFRHEHDLERRADRARVFHHVADELAQDRGERRVDLLVEVDHLGRGVDVEPRECVERELQHLLRRARRPRDVEVLHLRESLVCPAAPPSSQSSWPRRRRARDRSRSW